MTASTNPHGALALLLLLLLPLLRRELVMPLLYLGLRLRRLRNICACLRKSGIVFGGKRGSQPVELGVAGAESLGFLLSTIFRSIGIVLMRCVSF